ncbi:outer membrane protein [Aliiroseovarius sp. YM-037]|uniref:outer membrane protein n=1 Tax=Aliiroseovarius sp. YM-037 TaxID=3341728 RepID=UPI003A7F6DD5
MKRFLFLMVIAAGFGTAAHTETPNVDWSGFYVGGTLGFGAGDSENCDEDPCVGGAPFFPQTNPEGAVAGVTVGYNFNLGSNWVAGVEADYSFANMSGTSVNTVTFGCGDECRTEIGSFATLRARAGYAFGNFLPYATVGAAVTKYDNSFAIPVLEASSSTEISPVIGVGVEYKLRPNWSVKAEYLHIADPGVIRYAPSECTPPGCAVRNNQYDVLRIGLNYHF